MHSSATVDSYQQPRGNVICINTGSKDSDKIPTFCLTVNSCSTQDKVANQQLLSYCLALLYNQTSLPCSDGHPHFLFLLCFHCYSFITYTVPFHTCIGCCHVCCINIPIAPLVRLLIWPFNYQSRFERCKCIFVMTQVPQFLYHATLNLLICISTAHAESQNIQLATE